MYQVLLTRRYLTTKVMPLLAAGAVMLCTAMILLVWSIMGGFLEMLLTSGRTMVGDVSITWPTVGFGYYDELVSELGKEPDITGAAPIIEAFGMLRLPDGRVIGVQIKGIDGATYAKATGYADALWWKPLTTPLPRDKEHKDRRLIDPDFFRKAYADGMSLRYQDPQTGAVRPAAVLGLEVSGFYDRLPSGVYVPYNVGERLENGTIRWQDGFMVGKSVTLNVLPLDRKGRAIQTVSRSFPVANEFKTGLYDIDKQTVLVDLGALQQMLKMDKAERVEMSGQDIYGGAAGGEGGGSAPPVIGIAPARVTTVLVRAKAGVPPERIRRVCLDAYTRFESAHHAQVPGVPGPGVQGAIRMSTWEEDQATFIAAVQKETVMVLGILIFISIVATFLILAIFWAMIREKTKDIGVLRAVGASRLGVASLWLSYGLIIGALGSALGLALASGIVWNINPIHDWMGRALGITVWDPKVYYFTVIPNRVDPLKALLVGCGGVAFSVLGALIPAVRAAYMDPVQSLRFE